MLLSHSGVCSCSAGGPSYSYSSCGSADRYSEFNAHLSSMPRTTNLVAPLVSATSCLDLVAPSDACGPLVEGRTTFSNDWCALKERVENGTMSFANVLRGLTLDITILGDNEEWVEEASGGRLGGTTGDILNCMRRRLDPQTSGSCLAPSHALTQWSGD